MNFCILIGEIISEVEFDFCLNQKEHISIASCIVLDGKTKIFLNAFDELADELYSSYNKFDLIKVEGKVREGYVEIVKFI